MKPESIARIFYAPEGECGKYTVTLTSGIYLTFFPGDITPWRGHGRPIKEPDEEEITWGQVPSAYQAAILETIASA